jgi:DNA-binding response OmpR family regulator
MFEVLLADDAEDIHDLVRVALGDQYQVTSAYTIAQALGAIKEKRFDILLLDVTLSDGEGFQICAQARNTQETRQVPIIFLTARTEIAHKVTGFSLGADDYIQKPFDPLELNARVAAKLRRIDADRTRENVLTRGRLKIDLLRQAVTRQEDEGVAQTSVDLKPTEFKMLLHFMQNEEVVLSRQQLLDAIWGNATFIVDRTVDKHICSLRQKLGPCASYIQTVPSFGYKFSTAAAASRLSA